MKLKDFFELADLCVVHNTDLHKGTETMIVKISEHIKECSECRREFSYWLEDVEDGFQIEKYFVDYPSLSDWICNR